MKKIKHFMLLMGIFLLSSFAAFAQKTIKGTITDAESKEPLPGASVIIKGTAKGTFTDDKCARKRLF